MSNLEKNEHPFLCPSDLWINNDNQIWLGSTLTLCRNLEKFLFPNKLSMDKRNQIILLLSSKLLSSDILKGAQFIRAEDILPIEKEFLVEHFLSSQDFHQAHVGEAFVIDKLGQLLAIVNLRDHLVLHLVETSEELESACDRLINIETTLSQSTNFAFSPKFGFLTSEAARCGTGLIVRIFLHLPMLRYTRKLTEEMAKNPDNGILQSGLHGDPKDIIGDIVVFHNNYTLGLTEENIFASLRTLATRLVIEEKNLRQQMRQGREITSAEMKDRVSRAYAILLHSYQLEAVEALQALSLIKLGLDIEWLKGTTQAHLNHLLFSCRRAHLLYYFGLNTHFDELPHRRAEFIHKALSGLELLI